MPPLFPQREFSLLRVCLYAAADLFGFFCIAIGCARLVGSRMLIFGGFPASTAEAIACGAGGSAVIFWALARLLREIGRLARPGKTATRDAAAEITEAPPTDCQNKSA